MNDAGTPNATRDGGRLSREERFELMKARRKIWIDGMIGMGSGALLGGLAAMGYNRMANRRNPRLVTTGVLGGLAFGGFILSTTAAKNTIPLSVAKINHKRMQDESSERVASSDGNGSQNRKMKNELHPLSNSKQKTSSDVDYDMRE